MCGFGWFDIESGRDVIVDGWWNTYGGVVGWGGCLR